MNIWKLKITLPGYKKRIYKTRKFCKCEHRSRRFRSTSKRVNMIKMHCTHKMIFT